MPDPVSSTIALCGLALFGALALGMSIADAARDSGWWVVVRGIARGRYLRIMRAVRRG